MKGYLSGSLTYCVLPVHIIYTPPQSSPSSDPTMSLSFHDSLNTIESYTNWADPINKKVWFYGYLVDNSTGTYAVCDAYYQNNTFASTWLSIVGEEWKSLTNFGTDQNVDIYASRENATNYMLEIFDTETSTETTTTSSEVLESLGPNAVNGARQNDSISEARDVSAFLLSGFGRQLISNSGNTVMPVLKPGI